MMSLNRCPTQQFKEKIDSLFISVQSISLQDFTDLKYQQHNWNTHFQLGNRYTTRFHLIHEIYQLILQLKVQEITTSILHGYKSNSIITLQYLRKYKYLYQKTQHYYKITSNNNINIEQLALMNLYIINQIYHLGFYFLFKYLYDYK